MRIGLSLNEDMPIDRQRELARAAEAAGLASLWANDAFGRDPFLLCQSWAEVTSTIELGIGVVQLPTRTLPQLAKAAATLQEACHGRLRLGLGVSQADAMRRHGIDIAERPLAAARTALETIPAILRGEQTEAGFRLSMTPLPPPVPLYLGAMRPRSLALAGRHADGVLLSWEGPEAAAHAARAVRAAADQCGREPPRIAAYVRVAIAPDRAVARRALADQVAYYSRWYEEHFAAQACDGDLLHELGWYGTPDDDIAPFLGRFATAGVDHFIVRAIPTGDPIKWLPMLFSALGRDTPTGGARGRPLETP
jgi:5,10-methylenetetrahydromethanopterin reductase